MSVFLQAKNVSKNYGRHKALENLSLSVNKGQTYALLGPNGAGKTTFVKALLGLVSYDSGEISINGRLVNDPQSRSLLAYLPEKFQFYSFDTPQKVLRFYARARNLPGTQINSQIDRALEQVVMTDNTTKKLSKLSKGQMQRVGLASLLIGDPGLLILDEPFSGLDPIGIKELRDIIRGLKEQGKTLFINSHILAEMEKICDSLAVLDNGHCLAQGDAHDLLNSQSLENFFYNLVRPENS
jgi:ABC-2 type transport system ATP-binding protein